MMRDSGQEFWACGVCQKKNTDLKTVLDSIQTEISTIKKGQDEQQEERVRVLEGLKMVETVVKKIENIESVQAGHGERLTVQETASKSNAEKVDESLKRLAAVEDKMAKMDDDAVNIRLTNAVVREVLQIERNDKNVMVWNIPEPTGDEAEDRKRDDEDKVKGVLRELKMEGVTIVNVIRTGTKGGRFPRKIKVILTTKEDCNKVLERSEAAELSNDVRISRDKTFNQRQEARLFRLEKEEEREGVIPPTSTQRGRGRGKGPGRPKGSGRGGRGRGGVGGRSDRKRRISESELQRNEAEDEENKRRRTTPAAAAVQASHQIALDGASSSEPESMAAPLNQTPPQLLSATGRPGTPHPASRLAATDAEERNF